MAAPDRLERLLQQARVTGIDFVYVHEDQITLDVYFARPPLSITPSLANLTAGQIRIRSETGDDPLPEVPVAAIAWTQVGQQDVLRVTTSVPGDFSRYRLRIDDPRIDRYFNDVGFTFKANCPSGLDCAPTDPACPPVPELDVAVDTTARDFWSFRGALLDFASLRYPDWKDRLDADAGVMLAEVMSAAGDELAYYQDRIGREAYLETAVERRSVRRHARLVDYPMHDGMGATAWLDVTVSAGQSAALPAGAGVWATSDTGEQIDFEIGRGLAEALAGRTYAVDAARNTLAPHEWDEDATCLPVGATEVFVEGHHAADLPLEDTPADREPGRFMVLRTNPADPSLPRRVQLVRVVQVEDTVDEVFLVNLTRLAWEPEQALPFEMDLDTLEVRGNVVPATAGRTMVRRFSIGPGADPTIPPALEREGRDGSVAYLFSLPNVVLAGPMGPVDTFSRPGQDAPDIVRLGTDPTLAVPEVHLGEVTRVGGNWVEQETWEWRHCFVGVESSEPLDRHFVLDDGAWDRVAGYRRAGGEIVHRDYVGGPGATVRFGDGEFGLVPAEATVFQVTYRLGNGRRGNVAAGSITAFDPADAAFADVDAVENPLPASGGEDPETIGQVRQLAPEAFRAVTYRAVRPEDYADAAERLPWVQRAGAAFRWTGSWLTAFVTPDPLGSVVVTAQQRVDLRRQLDRFRQAGREASILDPRYADLDLRITVCVEASAYLGEVEERVLEALVGRRGGGGFFGPDNFTFGTPLERSRLEAAIQQVAGVRAVEGMEIRRRGWFDWRPFAELTLEVGDAEVLRLENDPAHPDRGSLQLTMDGGA
jgi:hypothetical protein